MKKTIIIAVLLIGLVFSSIAQSYGDVDLNGEITIVDALIIAQYYAGYISSLPSDVLIPPLAPIIEGVESGMIYSNAVTPDWISAEGTEDSVELVKDNEIVPFEKGTPISDDGVYMLSITREKTGGSKTSVAKVNFMIASLAPETNIQTNIDETGGAIDVYFKKGPEFDAGRGKPLYTIWLEDRQGRFVQNLFVSSAPGTNILPFTNSWHTRPSALPYWGHKACVEDPYKGIDGYNTAGYYLAFPTIHGGPIPVDLDAVTGATVYTDFLLESARKFEDLKQFKVLMEINRSFDSNDYYTADFTEDNHYPDSLQPSLIYSADISIGGDQVFFEMSLAGAGHYSGADGGLYSAEHHTTALELIDTVIVHVK